MADQGAAVPPAAAPPAAGGLAPPVLPDIPFGDEPGSLSGWILVETAESTNVEVLEYIATVQQRYEQIPDRIAQPQAHEEGVRALMLEDVLGSVEFAGFLQVSSLGGETATIQVVSNFARYSAGLGAFRALSGRVVGFLGGLVDDQLPLIVLVPTAAPTLKHLLTPESFQVPTREQILAHYSQPSPATLMPGLAAGAPQIKLCCIVALPAA
jgi:hypothetical protein